MKKKNNMINIQPFWPLAGSLLKDILENIVSHKNTQNKKMCITLRELMSHM